ncbi:type II toxin-antitoxin system PemK/MazF family toxin [Azorhizobium doebereinerae]|uniref:type II toxin-antitoxin system PemK/MazF family toxin n=1 Tax=Azorhizobium doebereinerae TaxID=281091 RepID=UPI0006880243|nr:type II toxin-antitoxin system PemK/MazF family toxin [Azorhizobium doebereinerae]
MATSDFAQCDVVRYRFPTLAAAPASIGPALIVSSGAVGEDRSLPWVVMITSAANRAWPGDVPLGAGYAEAGLPAPSVIRPAKIATIEAAHADRQGCASAEIWAAVAARLKAHLGL